MLSTSPGNVASVEIKILQLQPSLKMIKTPQICRKSFLHKIYKNVQKIKVEVLASVPL